MDTKQLPSEEREFSPIDCETIADRIRRANEHIVPAHGHTIASLRLEQSRDALLGQEQDKEPEDNSPATPSARRIGTRSRGQSLSQKATSDQRDALRRLSQVKAPAPDMQQAKMAKFLSGFRRFHRRFFADNTSLFSNLQFGQAPKTLLIGCCDSRADPAIITDCDPGDLFVIRNVANLVPPYSPNDNQSLHGTSAAMEFAVKGLKVENIIIMGHHQCGGIAALLKGDIGGYEFMQSWMRIAQNARDTTLQNFGDKEPAIQQRACEHASILCSLENLTSYPWIQERLANGDISINGWYFDFKNGDLLAYNPETNHFDTLIKPETPSVVTSQERGDTALKEEKESGKEDGEPHSLPTRAEIGAQ